MRAPPRPRFQRPRTQLVHLLLGVQPPARVPSIRCRGARSDSAAYPYARVGVSVRSDLDVGPAGRPGRQPSKRRRRCSARSFAQNIESEITISQGLHRLDDRNGWATAGPFGELYYLLFIDTLIKRLYATVLWREKL